MRKRIVLLVFVGVPLLALLAFCTQPWMLLNPIDRFNHVSPKQRSMIPEVFAQGEARGSAEARLAAAGYAHNHMGPYPEVDKCGDSLCERVKEGYTDFYRKAGAGWNIACSIDYVVWLSFDDSERLTKARNEHYWICI